MKTKAIFAAVALTVLTCGFAHAQTITGSVVFQGSATASRASDMSATPTTINFGNNWVFTGGVGDYSAILIFNPATFTSFSFTGDGTSAVLTAPDDPLWTTTYAGITYSFDLTTLTDGHTDAGSMAFTGMGTLHETGHTDTAGTFSFSGSGNNFSFIFDNEQNTAVPEVGSTSLFVLGLVLCVGVNALRRRRIFA